MTVLALDLGTQSVRALAFDATGALLDVARVRFDPVYTSPEPGRAEQDPEYYWSCVGRVCQELWAAGRVRPDQLVAVSMTFQRATVVLTDADGAPLRPAILWLDQRAATRYAPLPLHLRLALHLTGSAASVDRLLAGAPMNWVRQHEPDLWRRTRRYLLLSGFVTWRMTGEVRDSVACQVGPQPFDYRAHRWHPRGHWSWRSFPVGRSMLPELVPPGEPLGQVTAAAAAHTGLPPGLPVIAGGSDKACEVLGSGCVREDQACVGLGTTATLNVDAPRYLEPVRLVPAYPSAQRGHYNLEHQVFRGFWMVTWFTEQFARAEAERARAEGVPVEARLEAEAASVPPGSLGLTLQPYWSPGVQHPGVEAKGAILGFGGAHTRAHMYRAMLEGLAYALRDGRDRTVARTHTPLRELKVCGGGSRSDLVMQIMADVMGMPATRPHVSEASGLGAAILAAVGGGLHRDLPTAVAAMTRSGREFQPISEQVQLYDRLYTEVYAKIYPRLRPLYRSLMDITGYP